MGDLERRRAPGDGGLREWSIRCHACSVASGYPAYRCATCDAPLVADLAAVVEPPASPGLGIWRRRGLLPRCGPGVTLGEGETPLVPLGSVPGGTGIEVLAKLEIVNPTLSFKDRAMALGSSIALDHGMRGLVLASTGNAAASAAAYAAAAGLECTVFAGAASRAEAKLAMARAYGAEVRRVEGDYSAAYREAALAEGPHRLNVTTTYRNPLLAEAYRPMAFEIREQLGRTPDAIAVPIGAGPLLFGLLRGFGDLAASSRGGAIPRLIGVQAAACAPLARAWRSGEWLASLEAPLGVRDTVADAIADRLGGYEREGIITLEAVQESRGSIIAVEDDAIASAQQWLATRCGLLVEPAAAAAVAALEGASFEERPPRPVTVVVILTGHGAKEPPLSGSRRGWVTEART